MALSDREWRLIREESRRGPMNMALDEIAAETAAEGGPRTVRVYQWDPSTLSLGYRQEPETVAWEYCDREGITVTRRPTGGGGIYHDRRGDISYSIVAPADELPGDLMDTYELLCEPVFDAFDRLGIDARFTDEKLPAIHQPACYLRELHPAHDVVAGGSAAGAASSDRGGGHARKISGNAQYRRKDAVIQHGSLKFDLDAERHLGVFSAPDTTPEEFRERVTTMREQGRAARDPARERGGPSREEAVEAVEEALREWADAEEGSWTDDELSRARERAAEKFESDAWVREREDPTE
ncbi:lipoate--protein ligase family protein [Halorussus salilacus]|uniref:lipoate--protein ligase family protein n=1 Tax=Halorussus salilacus TaxID=2953750 RepID=UPI0020A1A6D5|nr:biotin/lipoate A/B protein ligase family protein [Halorussus salilacus]USZ69268.1 lipoate--protein ligase family protein [Halorussus salilacus]